MMAKPIPLDKDFRLGDKRIKDVKYIECMYVTEDDDYMLF